MVGGGGGGGEEWVTGLCVEVLCGPIHASARRGPWAVGTSLPCSCSHLAWTAYPPPRPPAPSLPPPRPPAPSLPPPLRSSRSPLAQHHAGMVAAVAAHSPAAARRLRLVSRTQHLRPMHMNAFMLL